MLEEEKVNSSNMLSQMRFASAVHQRRIYIDRDVDDSNVSEWIYYLDKIEKLDKVSNTKNPIEIHISSNGGLIYTGLRLVNRIEKMKHDGYEIITINDSHAFSMGFILSVIGTKRYSYKYSTYMIHDASSFTYGKVATMKEDLQETERIRDVLEQIIVDNTNISKETLVSWHDYKRDVYLDADSAIKYKICDEII